MITKEINTKDLPIYASGLSVSDHLFSTLYELPQPFILESSDFKNQDSCRFTLIGADPFLTIEATDKNIKINKEGKNEEFVGEPLDALNDLLARFSEKVHPDLPLCGGAVGYIGYEAGEPIPVRKNDEVSLPDLRFSFYDVVFIYEHSSEKLTIISTGQPEKGSKKKKRAKARLEQFSTLIAKRPDKKHEKPNIGETKSNFSHKDYIKGVERIQKYISEGDIYQANLSQRFKADFSGSPYLLYKDFRDLNPVSFGGYLEYDDLSIISNSPERFISLKGGKLETRQIGRAHV